MPRPYPPPPKPSTIPRSPGVSLFFSRGEFDDVVERLTTNPRGSLPLTKNAREYNYLEIDLWSRQKPRGHDSACIFLFLSFCTPIGANTDYEKVLPHGRVTAVDHSDIINLLDSEKSFSYLQDTPVYRSFPWSKKLTPETKTVLQ
jgi:hypothetical protein